MSIRHEYHQSSHQTRQESEYVYFPTCQTIPLTLPVVLPPLSFYCRLQFNLLLYYYIFLVSIHISGVGISITVGALSYPYTYSINCIKSILSCIW